MKVDDLMARKEGVIWEQPTGIHYITPEFETKHIAKVIVLFSEDENVATITSRSVIKGVGLRDFTQLSDAAVLELLAVASPVGKKLELYGYKVNY